MTSSNECTHELLIQWAEPEISELASTITGNKYEINDKTGVVSKTLGLTFNVDPEAPKDDYYALHNFKPTRICPKNDTLDEAIRELQAAADQAIIGAKLTKSYQAIINHSYPVGKIWRIWPGKLVAHFLRNGKVAYTKVGNKLRPLTWFCDK